MAYETISAIINGDDSIIKAFQRVKTIWDDFLSTFDWSSSDALKQMTSFCARNQQIMEQAAGKITLGHEIIAWVGIGQFYDLQEGFSGDLAKARLVHAALLDSLGSVELRRKAKSIGSFYGINEK